MKHLGPRRDRVTDDDDHDRLLTFMALPSGTGIGDWNSPGSPWSSLKLRDAPTRESEPDAGPHNTLAREWVPEHTV
jgi:hypothetical protein